MTKGRLEAFSDGVLAIIITIMVLELKVPLHADKLTDLQPLLGVFLSYVLSFVYVGIYWNNHHHLLQAVERIDGRVLWANLHLLFWLSLTPFVTAWIDANSGAAWPTALYGFVLFCAGGAYYLLYRALVAAQGEGSLLATAVGNPRKEWASLALYAIAMPLAFVNATLAHALYVVVAIIWLVPDRRIERRLGITKE